MNVYALGTKSAHFTPGYANGVDHWNIYNVVSCLAIVEWHCVTLWIGCIISGIHLSLSDLAQKMLWENFLQQWT